MDLTLILSLIKLGLEVFQDERKDRYLKKYLALEKDYQDELNKGLSNWSDLALDRMRFEARQLAQLIVDDANGKK
jgi:hypothetical protein